MASQLPEHMKTAPVGLAGEIHVMVLIDEEADEVTAVHFLSGDLSLTLTPFQVQELARVVNGDASRDAFSLTRYGDQFLIETRGDFLTAFILDGDELAQLQTVLARVQGIIEP